MSAKPALRLVPSTGEKLKVRGRKPNNEQRTKEYLTEAEVGRLMKAARKGRWGHRDATLILVMVRHGLRVTEAVDLSGIKSTGPKAIFTSSGLRAALIACIRCKAMSYGRCISYSVSKRQVGLCVY